MPLIARLRTRLASEDGFTLVAVLGVITIVLIMSVAAFAATQGDFKPSGTDRERKSAYAAAEAGVADFLSRITADPEYWHRCANAVNKAGNPALNEYNPTSRRWAEIDPDNPATSAEYSIELLPANGKGQCDPADAVGTFIDTDSGTFRIRSTGRTSAASTVRRTIITTFRRVGFLDYIYFTDRETLDPQWEHRTTNGRPTEEKVGTGPDIAGGAKKKLSYFEWGELNCRYWRNGRADKKYFGRYTDGAREDFTKSPGCDEIRFFGESVDDRDEVNGPLHTNDEILICGSPKFGRRPSDMIEVSAGAPGYRNDPGTSCAGKPVTNLPGEAVEETEGTWVTSSPVLELPPDNRTLDNEALPAYSFVGRTRITFQGDTMHVKGTRKNGTTVDGVVNIPKDGVIFVDNNGVCPLYDPDAPLASPLTCGDVLIKGEYRRNVTVAARNDIIVMDDLEAADDTKALLGLISKQWIRIYHPISSGGCADNATLRAEWGTGMPTDNTLDLDAAILSLQHSFTVDKYWCGSRLGNLNVTGAIAQKYRGPVATSGSTGYVKNYVYNDELRFRSPPRFLDPVQSSWRVTTQVEQVPAIPASP